MTQRMGRTARAAADGVGPVLTIMSREMRDTLRDWRIVVPIVVLVTIFPVLANFVASSGVGFLSRYGGDLIAERLFPFLMLVVGFFPSTFSLVIALETFVGEKERRSLEPLLATPLSDVQLYLGKLLAATVPPVLASYLGMVVYTMMLGLVVGWWPDLSLFILAMALSTIESVVMVAGAVIVSSQSTSVRAANLVASFIIVPMALLLQAEASLLLFANYDALWLIGLGLLIVATLLVRLGVRVFSREQLLGREIDELDLKAGLSTLWGALWPRRGLVHLYRREIPRLIRGLKMELLVTVLVVGAGGLLIGMWAVHHWPLPVEIFNLEPMTDPTALESLMDQSGLLPSFSTGAVFLNNVRALLLAGVLGLLSLGTLALLLLLIPVALIAYIGMQIGQLGISPWLFLAVTVLPHGIIELPAAIVATAQAMRMGDVILQPPDEGGGVLGIVREAGHFIKVLALIVAPLLLIAAWVEVHVTPRLLVWFMNRL